MYQQNVIFFVLCIICKIFIQKYAHFEEELEIHIHNKKNA